MSRALRRQLRDRDNLRGLCLHSSRESIAGRWTRLMLSISPAALTALSDSSFDSRVLDFIRRCMPGLPALGDVDALRGQIATGREAALRHGISSERGLAKWIVLALACGDRFYERREVAVALGSGNPDEVVRSIFDHLVAMERGS